MAHRTIGLAVCCGEYGVRCSGRPMSDVPVVPRHDGIVTAPGYPLVKSWSELLDRVRAEFRRLPTVRVACRRSEVNCVSRRRTGHGTPRPCHEYSNSERR